ncbi:MAG TPA: molybdenum cofactor biosynthesis protein MoaE [Spirochaetota bacterium]|nr:molybdenum cofactor biosynthesis protein MoaE [Spirochaetota bacterium]HPJ37046.1 molybdenum cofactor biosynthesis protein MoaE [Spirochaetota bacterium]HPQ52086.1 molybdenum cofactor biosynthesis protein MoaE [Spirochaetota bacterium]
MHRILIQKEKINIDEIIEECATDSDGALLTFIGRARNKTAERDVTHLQYEVYGDMAYSEIEKIAVQAETQWPITNAVIVHRYGRIEIGDTTIVIAVSSPHRDEGFKAVRYIIDTIKKTVPIWKKEYYLDDSSWVK